MKKILTVLALLFLFTTTASANNYAYNGFIGSHAYTLHFPTDWKIQDISSNKKGLSPKTYNKDTPAITIQEFNNTRLNEVINFFKNVENKFIKRTDHILDNKIVQHLEYENFRVWSVLRGNSALAFIENDKEYSENFEEIFQSIRFKDNWHPYLNMDGKYTILFPKSLKLTETENGINLSNIIEIGKHQTLPNDYSNIEEIIFNGYKATLVENNDHEAVHISRANGEFLITYSDHTSINEILNSFYFFELSEVPTNFNNYLFFPDVPNTHPNKTAINSLTQDKVVKGYPDGTFRPDGLINRAELTKMIIAAKVNPSSRYKNCFPDVEEQWFAPYICYAKDKGWVDGYPDGSFKPENQINRAEAIKIVLEAFTTTSLNTTSNKKLPSDVDKKGWYFKYINYAYNKDLLDLKHMVNNNYFPGAEITRKEVAEMIFRIN